MKRFDLISTLHAAAEANVCANHAETDAGREASICQSRASRLAIIAAKPDAHEAGKAFGILGARARTSGSAMEPLSLAEIRKAEVDAEALRLAILVYRALYPNAVC